MPIKDELGRLGNTELVVLCSKVSESATEQSASMARELKQEWASLQTPPELQLKGQQKKEAHLAAWRTRTIEFLAGIL